MIYSRKLRQTMLDTQQIYKTCKINAEGKLTCHWHGPVCKPVRRSREHCMILCNLQNPSEIEHNKPMLNTTNYFNNCNVESWRISPAQSPAKPIFLSKARGALNYFFQMKAGTLQGYCASLCLPRLQWEGPATIVAAPLGAELGRKMTQAWRQSLTGVVVGQESTARKL